MIRFKIYFEEISCEKFSDNRGIFFSTVVALFEVYAESGFDLAIFWVFYYSKTLIEQNRQNITMSEVFGS